VRIDRVNTPTLTFGEVIKILKVAEGTLCEVSVAPDLTGLEWSNVVHFEGLVGHVDEDPPGADVVLEILSSQGVRAGWIRPAVRAGWIQLSRTRFRATLDSDPDDPDDVPQTLTIWQRGIRLRLALWPPGTVRGAGPGKPSDDDGEASDDDVPF
jgi:hypothetical protein